MTAICENCKFYKDEGRNHRWVRVGLCLRQTPRMSTNPGSGCGLHQPLSTEQKQPCQACAGAITVTDIFGREIQCKSCAGSGQANLSSYEQGVRDAARIASTFCWNRQIEGRQLKHPAVFTSHTHQSISEAIHAALNVEPK
jgi:hypothetical protein